MENNNNENNNGILPVDLFNRFFGLGRRGGLFDMNDMFRGFDDVNREMSRTFDVFNDLSTNAPKELVREYETSDGGKVREVGPIVYGYSITVGPDGKPHVREFGNVKSGVGNTKNIGQYIEKPQISLKENHYLMLQQQIMKLK